VRAAGNIGVVGVYVPEDPGAATEEATQGKIAFDYTARPSPRGGP
jgi:glutathione-independent formaldehyde dehydrogenase